MSTLTARLCLLAAICAAALLQVNEAIRKLKGDDMSLDQALAVLRKSNRTRGSLPQLISVLEDVSLIQEKIGHKVIRKGKTQKKSGLRSHQVRFQIRSGTTPTIVEKVTTAIERIAEMLQDTVVEKDASELECEQDEKHSIQLIEESRRDQGLLETDRQDNQGRFIEYEGQVNSMDGATEELRNTFVREKQEGRREEYKLNISINATEADERVIDKLLNMTDCASSTSFIQLGMSHQRSRYSGSMQMLQCFNRVTKRHFTKLALQGQDSLWREFSNLQHPDSKELIDASFADEAFLQKVSRQDPEEPVQCSIAGSPLCSELNAKFLGIEAEIEERMEQLQGMLVHTQKRNHERAELFRHTEDHNLKAMQTYSALMNRAKGRVQAAMMQIQPAKDEVTGLEEEKNKNQMTCKEEQESFESEMCALKHIRSEVEKMYELDLDYQDCEVGDWVSKGCSAQCDYGEEEFTREVMVHPSGVGSKCPPLVTKRRCYVKRCPIRCDTTIWSNYTRCTGLCEPGRMYRTRAIRNSERATEPCGVTEEYETCQTIPDCKSDCVLSNWGEWSAKCSAQCSGGRKVRRKAVLTAERGGGTCDAYHSTERFEEKACNTQKCAWDAKKRMVCDEKINVVMVFDGSGSLYWLSNPASELGWRAVQNATEQLISYMGDNVQVGALLFHGPRYHTSLDQYFNDRARCMGLKKLFSYYYTRDNEYVFDASKHDSPDCGLEWMELSDARTNAPDATTRMTTDKEALAAKIAALQFPNGWATMTNLAIRSAAAELEKRNDGARRVIVVLTDGQPTRSDLTISAAIDVTKQGIEIIFVPVGDNAVNSYAFTAAVGQDQVVNIRDVNDLFKYDKMEAVGSKFCRSYHMEVPS